MVILGVFITEYYYLIYYNNAIRYYLQEKIIKQQPHPKVRLFA